MWPLHRHNSYSEERHTKNHTCTHTHITHKHRQMRSRARTHNTQYAMENSFQLKSVPNEDINKMNFGLFCYLSYFSSSSGFLLRRRKQQQQQQWNEILLCVCFVTARVQRTQCILYTQNHSCNGCLAYLYILWTIRCTEHSSSYGWARTICMFYSLLTDFSKIYAINVMHVSMTGLRQNYLKISRQKESE